MSLSSLGSLMDNLSQTSLSSDHSSTNSIGGIVEVVNIEPGRYIVELQWLKH